MLIVLSNIKQHNANGKAFNSKDKQTLAIKGKKTQNLEIQISNLDTMCSCVVLEKFYYVALCAGLLQWNLKKKLSNTDIK